VELRSGRPGTDESMTWEGEGRGELAGGQAVGRRPDNTRRVALVVDSFTEDVAEHRRRRGTDSARRYVRLVDRTRTRQVRASGSPLVELENAIMAYAEGVRRGGRDRDPGTRSGASDRSPCVVIADGVAGLTIAS